MILNLHAVADTDGRIVFNIPRITFDRRFNYKVGVSHINFAVATGRSTGSSIVDNELLCINTNIVDLSVQNPTQTILHFVYHSRRTIQNSKPPIVIYHALQLYEFENASFELRRFFSNEPIQLKYLFLQLEIIRLDAYGRLQ